jgi:Rad3-related DNA helicase
MGRGNYPCVHPDNRNRTCDDCLHADEGMHKCDYSRDCVYLHHKDVALHSDFVCVNYAYWLSAKRFRESNIKYLVLDECHLLSDICLDWVGSTFNDVTRAEWRLPIFPRVSTANTQGRGEAIGWMVETREVLRDRYKNLKAKVDHSPQLTKKMRKCERMGYNLNACIEAIESAGEAWYVKGGPGAGYYRGNPVPGIVIRPLTARYHFGRLFSGDWKTLLMSATVGDFSTFAEELGIRDPLTRRVPSNFPPSTRPIYILDAPKMSHKSTATDYDKQASEIARAIRRAPESWSGLIHVTRKKESRLLGERLEKHGLSGRIWVPPYKYAGKFIGTNDQARMWEDWLKNYPDSIAIAWQFMEGYDGLNEKICGVAKTMFPFLGDPYEQARMKYSHRMYNQRTAWVLQQSLGRTRRGRPEDYDTEDEMRGMVFVADGNHTRVKKYLDEDFVEAMVKI